MIAEKGVFSGSFEAEVCEPVGCWEDCGLVRSVSEAEERRSVTAEVAEAMVVLENSIWEDVYILDVTLANWSLRSAFGFVETFAQRRATHSFRGRLGSLCSLLSRQRPEETSGRH